jgi:hypothetical protein
MLWDKLRFIFILFLLICIIALSSIIINYGCTNTDNRKFAEVMVGISSGLTFFILFWKLLKLSNSRNKVQPAGPLVQLIPTSAQIPQTQIPQTRLATQLIPKRQVWEL